MPKSKEDVLEKSDVRDSVLARLNKAHGLGTIGVYTDMPKLDVEVISTGSMNLDIATGIGGLPRGRMIEIFGPESSGKTTLGLSAVAEVQKRGGLAAYIDIEHALDPTYMEAIGVDLNSLVLSQPSHGEMAVDIIGELATSGAFDIVVLDSVAAMIPKAELEGDVTDYHIGTQARLMSKACRMLGGTLSKTKTSLVFINQIRQKIGVMFGCFHYDSRVQLADGSMMKIGKIVNQKLPVEVMSFNSATGKIEPKKVVAWHDNGNLKDDEYFLQFVVKKCGSNGKTQFACTPNHKIFIPSGSTWREVQADELDVGDKVMVAILGDIENADESGVAYKAVEAEIMDIYQKPSTRSKRKFDLTIEDNSTYIVDGVIVHNSPETTTGGLALKFWSSLRIESRRKGSVKDGDNDATGNDTVCKVVKNKLAPPFRSAVFEITFGKGINKIKEIADLATDMELVDKAGSWYKIDGKNVAQGMEQLCNYLSQNQDIAVAFEKQIREKYNLK